MAHLTIGCQVLLATVFGWSALSKLRSRTAFASFARSLTPLVRRSTPVAATLVAVETALPALLVAVPRWGFVVAAGVLVVLSTGIYVVIRRGLAVQCQCFSTRGERLGPVHLVRNAILVVVALLGSFAVALAGTGGVHLAGLLLAAGFAFLVSTVFIRLDDVVSLFT